MGGSTAGGRSPFYLALPTDVLESEKKHPRRRQSGGTSEEVTGGAGGRSLLRLGRYMPHGSAPARGCEEDHHRERRNAGAPERDDGGGRSGGCLVWRAARGRVRLRVRLVEASSAAASAAVRGCGGDRQSRRRHCLPALVVVHRPGHFDSLQPPRGHVLVLEREEDEEEEEDV